MSVQVNLVKMVARVWIKLTSTAATVNQASLEQTVRQVGLFFMLFNKVMFFFVDFLGRRSTDAKYHISGPP